jgi:hypothetical protein
VADHVRRQDGLLTRAQALAAGVPAWQIESLLRRGEWSRVLAGVYRAGSGPDADLQLIRAAHLWAGPDSIVTGAAALRWQRRRDEPVTTVDLATTKRLRVPDVKPRILAHRQRIHEFWVAHWNGIRVARAEYAIAQLLPTEGPVLLDDAVRRRWVSVEMVMEVHRSRPDPGFCFPRTDPSRRRGRCRVRRRTAAAPRAARGRDHRLGRQRSGAVGIDHPRG